MSQPHWMPKLLQLTDPALPIGAYAHSLGLEGLVQAGVVSSTERLQEFLKKDVLASAQEVDLPIIRLAYTALQSQDYDTLAELDEISWACRQSPELRTASQKMGRQLLQLSDSLLTPSQMGEFQKAKEHLPYQQNLTVIALYYYLCEIPVREGLSGYVWQMFSGFAQAGLKLLFLGPFAVQKLLSESLEHIDSAVEKSLLITKEQVGGFLPIWDICSSQHKYAHSRLFIS